MAKPRRAITIVELLAPLVAALNTNAVGEESNAPIFYYGPKSFQNTQDDVDITNGVVYLDEPVLSNDTLKLTGYLEERYSLGILFGFRGGIDLIPTDERILIDKARELRRRFINLLSLSKLVRYVNNIRTIDITKEYDLSLSGCFLTIDVTPLNPLSNCLPEIAVVTPLPPVDTDDSGTDTGIGERILLDTRFSVNILRGSNLNNLSDPDYIAAGIACAFTNYYVWIDPPSISGNTATEAAKINAFIALMPNNPHVDFYYDVRWPDSDMDALFAVFPNAEAIIYNAESEDEDFDPSYSALVNLANIHCAGRAEGIINNPLVYRFNPDAITRRADVQNITGLTIGSQYNQPVGLAPDPIRPSAITTDYAANVALILNYYDVTREQYLTDFFSQYPLQDQEAITQWDCIDTGSTPDNISGTAFENWMLGMEVYFDLKHTDKYWYLAWLQLSNLPNHPRLDALVRLSPLFRFKYSEPYDLGIAGTRTVKVYNDDGSAALLINNSTAAQPTYPRENVTNLTGNFDLYIGWAAGFGDAPTSLNLTDQTDIIIKPNSVTVAYFQMGAPPPTDYLAVVCTSYAMTTTKYTPDSWGVPQYFDMYLQTCGANSSRPVFIGFHGGGQTRANYKTYPKDFASRDWAGISADFGYAAPNTALRQKEEVIYILVLVHYIKTHAGALGIDPDNVFLGGNSAGAVASLQALIVASALNSGDAAIVAAVHSYLSDASNYSLLSGIDLSLTMPNASFNQSGAANTPYNAFIVPGGKPSIFIHGFDDHTVYNSWALTTYNAMVAAGIAATFVQYPSPNGHDLGPHHDEILLGGGPLLEGGLDIGVLQHFINLLT